MVDVCDLGSVHQGAKVSKQLSPHFTLEELCHSEYAIRMGLDNSPTQVIIDNLTRLADKLELVRSICGGVPVIVTSAFRSPIVNAGVGGSPGSSHQTGNSGDFLVPAYGRPEKVVALLRTQFPVLQFDQLILEYPESKTGGWTHMGFATKPRGQVLVKRAGRGYEHLPL